MIAEGGLDTYGSSDCRSRCDARRSAGRRLVLLLLLLSCLLWSPVGWAQQPPEEPRVETLAQLHYRLEHQPSRDALSLVEALLSPRGTVELRPGTNTLVLRDHRSRIDEIIALIREFDHPRRSLRLEMYILLAMRSDADSSAQDNARDLPAPLVESLGSMLRFNSYELLAKAKVEAQEGEEVETAIGDDYRVDFTVGTVLGDGNMLGEPRLKLRGFELTRASGERVLYADLNLKLGKTLAIGESQSGLVVALTCYPISDLATPTARED